MRVKKLVLVYSSYVASSAYTISSSISRIDEVLNTTLVRYTWESISIRLVYSHAESSV